MNVVKYFRKWEENFMLKYLLSFIIIVSLILLSACGGPKERKAESVLDTPEYHYNQGKKYLEKDDLTNALREFNEAKSLKADFAPAYEGIALVNILQKNFTAAEENIDKALSEDGDWVPAVVAMGRLYSAKGQYEDAIDELSQIEGSKVLLITDPVIEDLGHLDIVKNKLEENSLETKIFLDVEPDPSIATVQAGAKEATEFSPDWIVGIGGGSVMDAAKGIWILYERPDLANEMDSITPGSQHIVKILLDESDNQPIWVQAWGGTNTIARALKTIEEEHPDKMEYIANKLRFFFIWEQDSTYQSYIRPHWGKFNIPTIISDQFIAIMYYWKQTLPQEQQMP